MMFDYLFAFRYFPPPLGRFSLDPFINGKYPIWEFPIKGFEVPPRPTTPNESGRPPPLVIYSPTFRAIRLLVWRSIYLPNLPLRPKSFPPAHRSQIPNPRRGSFKGDFQLTSYWVQKPKRQGIKLHFMSSPLIVI